jgi:hypothetical protein
LRTQQEASSPALLECRLFGVSRLAKRLIKLHDNVVGSTKLRCPSPLFYKDDVSERKERVACALCRWLAGAARAGSREQVGELVSLGAIRSLAPGLRDAAPLHALAALDAIEAILSKAERGAGDCLGEFDADCDAEGVPAALATIVREGRLSHAELTRMAAAERSLPHAAPGLAHVFRMANLPALSNRAACLLTRADCAAALAAPSMPDGMPALVNEQVSAVARLCEEARRALDAHFPLFEVEGRPPAEPAGDCGE